MMQSLLFLSCSSKIKKYESNWIVTKFNIDGKASMEDIMMPNFTIDVTNNFASPPSLYSTNLAESRKLDCPINLFTKNGIDYLQLYNHFLFSGIYKIKCEDKACCKITMISSKIMLEMEYNGDLPYGKSRKCPTPTVPSISE